MGMLTYHIWRLGIQSWPCRAYAGEISAWRHLGLGPTAYQGLKDGAVDEGLRLISLKP